MEKYKRTCQVNTVNDAYNIETCMDVLEGREGVGCQQHFRACAKFKDPEWCQMFMKMSALRTMENTATQSSDDSLSSSSSLDDEMDDMVVRFLNKDVLLDNEQSSNHHRLTELDMSSSQLNAMSHLRDTMAASMWAAVSHGG
ncbi:unnamed protein product [Ilex paraguariensis]|uniref:Uncharacterized protein n=1 Tax=Ilex paraguariensis TaxID=185542 RepID=A0ABC8SSE1_9AQUA